jgi:hypothetical protein
VETTQIYLHAGRRSRPNVGLPSLSILSMGNQAA